MVDTSRKCIIIVIIITGYLEYCDVYLYKIDSKSYLFIFSDIHVTDCTQKSWILDLLVLKGGIVGLDYKYSCFSP